MVVNMFPTSALQRVVRRIRVEDEQFATIVFADIAGFTAWCSTRTPDQVVEMLNAVVTAIDTAKAGVGYITKIKTIGDAYWAACGIPEPVGDHAVRALVFADCIHETLLKVLAAPAAMHHRAPNLNGESQVPVANEEVWGDLKFRVGVHSGPVIGAIIDNSRLTYEVHGPTSEIAEEIESLGIKGKTCCSSTTVAAAGKSFAECFSRRDVVCTSGGIEMHLVDAEKLRRLADGVVIFSDESLERQNEQSTADEFEDVFREDRQNTFGAKHASGGYGSGEFAALDITPSNEEGFFHNHFSSEEEQQLFSIFHRKEYYTVFAASTLFLFLFGAAVSTILVAEGTLRRRPYLVGWYLVLAVVPLAVFLFSRKNHEVPIRLWAVTLCILFPITIFLEGIWQGTIISNTPAAAASTFLTLCTVSALPCIFLVPFSVAFTLCTVGLQIVYWGFSIGTNNLVAMLGIFLAAVAKATEKHRREAFKVKVMSEATAQQRKEQAELLGDILSTIMPEHTIPRLLAGKPVVDSLDRVIVGFIKTSFSFVAQTTTTAMEDHGLESLSLPEEHHRRDYLLDCRLVARYLDSILAKHRYKDVHKVKTIGDVAMVAGPLDQSQGRPDDVRMKAVARQVVEFTDEFFDAVSEERPELECTAGYHVGPAIAAVVGTSQLVYDVFGTTVNAAARVLKPKAPPGSEGETTRQLPNRCNSLCSADFAALVSLGGHRTELWMTCEAKGLTHPLIVHRVLPEN